MVSIRRRKLLGLCSGRNSSVAPLSKSEHGQYPENRVDNTKPVSVHPMVLDDIDPPKEKISVEIGPGSSNVPASSPSKEHPIHQFPDVVELFELSSAELELIRDVYLRPASSREYERLIFRKQPFENFCLISKKEEYLHRRHPTPDMATIVAATSTAGRKVLKGTSAGAKKVRERVSKEAAVREAEDAVKESAPLSTTDKGKTPVVESPKKRFRVPREDGAGGSADVPPPRSEVPVGEKLLGTSLAAAPVPKKRPLELGV